MLVSTVDMSLTSSNAQALIPLRRSAGIIAYQLLTGRLPFSGDDGDDVAELYMRKQLFENRV